MSGAVACPQDLKRKGRIVMSDIAHIVCDAEQARAQKLTFLSLQLTFLSSKHSVFPW